MKKNQLLFLGFMLFMQSVLQAQVTTIFNNTLLNDSFQEVQKKTSSISQKQSVFKSEDVRFPLAKNSEVHLLCENLKTANGTINKVVFTFADDKLVYVEAKGNVNAIIEKRTDTARTYMDYSVYFSDGLFVKKKTDQAWILNKEGTHVNLFTWENPVLKSEKLDTKKATSNSIPSFIKMGATLKEMQTVLESNSKFSFTEKLDGSDPNAQLQINAFGVDYSGFPRKVEARFGNERLNVVWILTGKGEEDRIRQSLIKQYGKPIYTDENWEIFNDWQVGLRKDKPEVLLMEEKLGKIYKKQYFKQ